MNTRLCEFTIPDALLLPFSVEGLDRFDVEAPMLRPATNDDAVPMDVKDWDEIHRVVQGVFSDMTERVRRETPSIRSRGGRSSGRSFPLFTFRTFDLGEGQEIDPVIVGIIFEHAKSETRMVLRGDIGGECSGRVDFELPERETANSLAALLPSALSMALVLGEQWLLVAQKVYERHPLPDY
jgi:hypothetical protein